jgi:hypothetical protein
MVVGVPVDEHSLEETSLHVFEKRVSFIATERIGQVRGAQRGPQHAHRGEGGEPWPFLPPCGPGWLPPTRAKRLPERSEAFLQHPSDHRQAPQQHSVNPETERHQFEVILAQETGNSPVGQQGRDKHGKRQQPCGGHRAANPDRHSRHQRTARL